MTKRNVLIEEGSVNGIVVFNRQDSWKSFMTVIEYLEPHGKEERANRELTLDAEHSFP